ncbi:L-sorbose 1-dehydrogenase [Colletotrichum sp. SAR11_59]|nr:L-sorbose 1-dehydrogenase [Colletotrichum sp. SAR11_59]
MGSIPQDLVYDFVICGGGTSGCVVASRLAENPNTSVLVIEAGEHNKDLENVHMTGGWSQLFDKETDWNVISEPKAAVNNRQVKLSRGKFLGGCSGCNGTLCIRGAKQDYDDWDAEGWSGEDFFKYIRKAENFHGKEWFKASSDHGTEGHLDIEPHDLAPISNLIMDSMVDKGLPLDHDMFTHGNNPHGCGHAPRTVYKGTRTTAANFVTNANTRDNLHLMTQTHVDKVIIENVNGELKATGVRAVKPDGSPVNIKATKEIIVSGGAYCSPNILNRSGIGAKSELEKFGIQTLVDLPSVGKNLMDHLIVFMFYETEKEGLTNDHHVYHGDNFAKTYALWKDHKAGFLSTFPFGAFAYARLDDRLADSDLWKNAPREEGRDPMGLTPKQPNIEFFTTECYGGPKQFDKFPVDNKHAFSMIAELFAPKSRGTVTLRSTDATAVPVVDTNYLADPLDVEVLAEACRFGNEIIMQGKGTKGIVKGSWPSELVHHKYTTREEWIPYVKDNATTCYHAAGTCAMGKADDPKAVVDHTLTVKGVKGLRVADCSIMPTLNGGHTQMPAYGIGEKAADLIKETWKLK